MTPSFRTAIATADRWLPRPAYANPPGPLPFTPAVSAPAAFLSGREQEIAELVAQGLSNKEIGLVLGISHWTVSTHLRRVFAKLDICRRVDLCRLVTSWKVIGADDEPRSHGAS